MEDLFTFNSENNLTVSAKDCLVTFYDEANDVTSGHIFKDDFLATNWDTIDVHPASLPVGEVAKGMRKATSPVLLLKSHSSKMAFVLASEEHPVYFQNPLKRDKIDGYTMLFTLKPSVWPEYFFYLSKYKSWTFVSRELDELHALGLDEGFSHVGYCNFDGLHEWVEHAEICFLNGALDYRFPSLAVQRQQIDDAKMMERVIFDKYTESERKFQTKEWLNEAHIRNCKHRLSGEIMPLRMAVERLERNFTKSSEGLKLSSIIGKATQQTVGDMLLNMKSLIHKLDEEIENLTKSENVGENVEIIDVEEFIREYIKEICLSYNRHFVIDLKVIDKNLGIGISRKSFIELLDNVISNAVRHGFTETERTDYKIQISISRTNDNFCRIDIANNGNPISERGRNEYFVKGSFAGETGHSGIGGARVYEICDDYQGNAFKPYSIEGFPVVVSVEFPIVSL